METYNYQFIKKIPIEVKKKINNYLRKLLVIKKLIIKYSIKYYRKAIKKPYKNQKRTQKTLKIKLKYIRRNQVK